MKLREWILEGTASDGDTSKPMRVLTTPKATRIVAYKKMCCEIPEHLRFCVCLRKGKIIDVR